MSDSFDDFEFDADDLAEIEIIEKKATTLPPRSFIPKNLVQTNLFGRSVSVPAKPTNPPLTKSNSFGEFSTSNGPSPSQAKVKNIKIWDRSAFAKSGWNKKKAAEIKARAKGKSADRDTNGWDEEEVVEDDDETLLDESYDPEAEVLPIKWPPNPETSKSWHFPVLADKPLRNYQLNIVQRALFDNTLVSLPTGLGKTFIAACVMLNFYRWFPASKIIFLAPTRPLVTQQIKACHYIAGIPQTDSIELTGETPPKLRALAWVTRRVIYCTPQTFENDLAKGRVDPRDISCIVIDEAHRASGDYSYCGVVRFMMCRNPHFRILALTATPGSKGEAVQEVIDNLHIGQIEVRAENSIDIIQYIHKKEYDLRHIILPPEIISIRNRWAEMMKPYYTPLQSANLIWVNIIYNLSPFAVQLANQKIRQLPGGSRANAKYYPMVKILATMARAMEYLLIESVTSFYDIIKDLQMEGPKTLVERADFKQLATELGIICATPGYVGHPKMDTISIMCAEHFKASQGQKDDYGNEVETRVMIFCNFRAVVEEIVDCLNATGSAIKATAFVGQATSKGKRGKSQKEQLETIKKFKSGVYNVLVATSIGEEGLDIGEIDLIICYEANKSPIRMLQRIGRTGRARDGKIIVLMTKDREDRNWDKAKDAYQHVQNALVSKTVFECYADGDRMIPTGTKPVLEKVAIEALPLDLNRMTMLGDTRIERQRSKEEKEAQAAMKRKERESKVPKNAVLGFQSASTLKRKRKDPPLSPASERRKRRSEALLTLEEEEELRKWQFPVGMTQGVQLAPINVNNSAFTQGGDKGTKKITCHSRAFTSYMGCMSTLNRLREGNDEALDEWYTLNSEAFNKGLVDFWNPTAEERQTQSQTRTPFKRISRPPIEPEPPTPSLTNITSSNF